MPRWNISSWKRISDALKKALCSGISRNRGLFCTPGRGKLYRALSFPHFQRSFPQGLGKGWENPARFSPGRGKPSDSWDFPGQHLCFLNRCWGKVPLLSRTAGAKLPGTAKNRGGNPLRLVRNIAKRNIFPGPPGEMLPPESCPPPMGQSLPEMGKSGYFRHRCSFSPMPRQHRYPSPTSTPMPVRSLATSFIFSCLPIRNHRPQIPRHFPLPAAPWDLPWDRNCRCGGVCRHCVYRDFPGAAGLE